MKSVDYHVFMREKKEKILFNLDSILELKRRLPSRRPRDPEERQALLEFDRMRYETWIRKGFLEKLGTRIYRINFDKMREA